MRLRPGVKAVAALAALAFGAFVPVPALAPATPAAAAVGTEDGTRTINVLGITDLHGHIETTTDPGTGAVTDPGAVTLACEVSRARQSDPNSLLVSSGDNVGASAFTSALLDDQPTLDVLNAVGTDVSAVGNHEFDGGLDDFTGRILPAADFPYLSANVTGSAPLDAEGDGGGAFVKEVDGVKIGFVGIMTDELPTLLAPATANALTLAPAAATANAKAAALKNSGAADVVVVLAHADAAELAPHLTGDVDAVLGGHTHVPYPADGGSAVVKSTDGQDIAVLQADHYGWRLAELSLSYDPATRAVSVVSADNKDLRTSDCTTDAYGVESIVSNASTRAAEVGNERAAAIGSDFLRGSSDGTTPGTNRGTESTASNLIADSFASWASGNVPRGDAEHVIGLMNAGGVRADYLYARNAAGGEADDGIVTEGESRSVQPFGNEMGYATITGPSSKPSSPSSGSPAPPAPSCPWAPPPTSRSSSTRTPPTSCTPFRPRSRPAPPPRTGPRTASPTRAAGSSARSSSTAPPWPMTIPSSWPPTPSSSPAGTATPLCPRFRRSAPAHSTATRPPTTSTVSRTGRRAPPTSSIRSVWATRSPRRTRAR